MAHLTLENLTMTTPAPRPSIDATEAVRRIAEWPAWARHRYYVASLGEVIANAEALADSISQVVTDCPATHATDPESFGAALEVVGLLRKQLEAQSRLLAQLVPQEVHQLIDLEKAGIIDERPAPTPWRGCA